MNATTMNPTTMNPTMMTATSAVPQPSPSPRGVQQQSASSLPLRPSVLAAPLSGDEVCAHCQVPSSGWPETGQPEAYAFADQRLCSAACLEALLRATLAEEHARSTAAALETGPRVRIGEILIEQGVITEAQLERALRSQRLTGAGRLGTWLRQQTQLPEEDFAAALSIQWRCPVFRVGAFAPERMAGFLPRPLVETLGALPLRLSREPERLTICFEDRLDYELLRACERMHGIPVEGGLLASNEFWYGSGELLKASFPPARLVEATSIEEMICAMTETLVSTQAHNAHLVYVRGYYWLRLWLPAGVPAQAVAEGAEAAALAPRDILCTLRLSAESAPEGQLADEMAEGLERRRLRLG